jgi:RND superfamily putative drug exporter
VAAGGKRSSSVAKRRARAGLALALLCIATLGALGIGVEEKLRPTSVQAPGTESAEGSELLREHFGNSAPFAILLRGPAAALDRQGPRLVRALRTSPETTTLSPWDQGRLERLRPSPTRALVLVDFHVDADTAVSETVPELDRLLEATVRPPVRAKQTGFATLSRALQDESVSSTRTAELIAVPILLLVLLLVFRSPIAAAIPLALGAAAVVSSRGILSLAASHFPIDGFSLTVTSMMGLALGVDYALLMVSRFREELAAGTAPLEAAARTRRTAGMTTAFAGSTLLLAMAVTLWIMPGSLFLSLAATAILVTAISVALAMFVAPPLLFLLGPRIDSWRLGGDGGGKWLMGAVGAVLLRPRLAAVAIGGALLLLALPVLSLKTGPPSAAQLPASNAAREDAEAIADSIGAGWDAPFLLVAASGEGPITTERRLGELGRTQRLIARDRGVQTVIGPAQIQRRVAPLQKRGEALLAERGSASPKRVSRLGERLGVAAGGLGQLRDGIAEAAAGAGLLATGSDRAGEGAAALSGGLAQARDGASGAVVALDRLEKGSGRLARGQDQAVLGSRAVRDELSGLLPVLRSGSLGPARKLRDALRDAAAEDPSLAPQAREAEQLVEALALARNQAQRAQAYSSRLVEGQRELAEGGEKLHEGIGRLANAARPLPSGLDSLRRGADTLGRGLDRLGGGAESLSGNLAEGFRRSEPLQRGVRRASVSVSASGSRLERQVDALRRSSPRIFDSGSFVLSALEGAPPQPRERAGQVIDLRHGGQAAQILVIPRFTFNTPGSAALGSRLDGVAEELAASSGLQTGVTGGPAQLDDYDDAISSRVPLVIAVITLATFLILVLVLRAVPLAAIAVALNLLTVAIAFSVLTLLFDVPAGWPLGGHDYVDAIGAAGIFGIVFGLSIDYAVFLLSRMRERREAGAGNEEAVLYGLRRTASVITGAAAIMVAVFVAFAAAPVATVSQLGTGLTVAVVLDATIVRIILLPALMLWLGERVWWMPSFLERKLPRIGLHAA